MLQVDSRSRAGGSHGTGSPMAVAFGGLGVPPRGCEDFRQWEHMFCSPVFYLSEGMREFYPPESSAQLPSWAGTGCHDADTFAAPIG